MQDELQDSDSSGDVSAELVIKPPQSLAGSNSVFCQSDKKRRRHLEKHRSSKKHHHSHANEDVHVKSLYADSSNRNQNYKEIKRKGKSKEPKINFMKEDMIDSKSKKLIKGVFQSGRKRNEYQEVTNVRHTKSVKDNRESRRCSYKSEDRDTYFLEEMKIEWRHKRLQWLRHQKKQDYKLWKEKETDLQDKNKRNVHPECSRSKMSSTDYFQHDDETNYSVISSGENNERKFNKLHKNEHPECFRSTKISSTDNFQLDDEINYHIISPASSEEENIDCREDEKSKELIDDEHECMNDQENTGTISDTSNDDNIDAAIKSEEETVEAESTCENEKVFSLKESPYTENFAETLAAKPVEKNEIHVIATEKCLSVASTYTHPPKLPVYCPAIQGCRSIDGFHVLNRIEEGTYGIVYRARDKQTKEIVALKRLKMEREKEGFPITSLREINTLLKAQHPNIVTVREIVVGSHMDKIFIVMDYVEHDLKSLMKIMPRPFLIGEVKTLLMQLLCAVAHLHDNWILHRDLKTSNLLLSHQGILKVGDFGLAREYGSPLKSYTPVVVTLWYRAPELLLGAKKYSTPIDMWSVGCIFGELLTKNALFPGKSESDQLNKIFKDLGTPNENIWPGYSELPLVQSINIPRHPYNILKNRFSHTFTDLGFDLLNRFLTYNPARRISAEKAKEHEYFTEKPKPVPPEMFPTWPAKSERVSRAAKSSPKPPLGGMHY